MESLLSFTRLTFFILGFYFAVAFPFPIVSGMTMNYKQQVESDLHKYPRDINSKVCSGNTLKGEKVCCKQMSLATNVVFLPGITF